MRGADAARLVGQLMLVGCSWVVWGQPGGLSGWCRGSTHFALLPLPLPAISTATHTLPTTLPQGRQRGRRRLPARLLLQDVRGPGQGGERLCGRWDSRVHAVQQGGSCLVSCPSRGSAVAMAARHLAYFFSASIPAPWAPVVDGPCSGLQGGGHPQPHIAHPPITPIHLHITHHPPPTTQVPVVHEPSGRLQDGGGRSTQRGAHQRHPGTPGGLCLRGARVGGAIRGLAAVVADVVHSVVLTSGPMAPLEMYW